MVGTDLDSEKGFTGRCGCIKREANQTFIPRRILHPRILGRGSVGKVG